MRILGIDPGSTVTGLGVIDFDGRRSRLVTAAAVSMPRGARLPIRILRAADALRDALREHRPDEVSLESLFQHANVRAALVLAHVRGALVLELARAGYEVHEYTALQVKKALVGHGLAGKEQVQSMVRRLLGPAALPRSHDASDALAVAVCHAHTRQWRIRCGGT